MIHTDGQPTISNRPAEAGIASRVQAAREESFKNQETLTMAVELAATLGFCQGFLGKNRLGFTEIMEDFPEDYRPEMAEAYLREYAEGAAFVEIPIAEIHPDNPFSA